MTRLENRIDNINIYKQTKFQSIKVLAAVETNKNRFIMLLEPGFHILEHSRNVSFLAMELTFDLFKL